MAQIWEHSPANGAQLLIELALADFANDEGICWPSIATVASKARCSEEWVHKVIAKMRREGRISIQQGGGRAKTNVYKLLLAPLNPVSNTPFAGAQRVNSVRKRVNSVPERVKYSTPDPSLEPSSDPPDNMLSRACDAIAASFAVFGKVTAGSSEAIVFSVADYGSEWVSLAVRRAAGGSFDERPPWSYVETILARWKKQGSPDDERGSNGRVKASVAANGRGTRGSPAVTDGSDYEQYIADGKG